MRQILRHLITRWTGAAALVLATFSAQAQSLLVATDSSLAEPMKAVAHEFEAQRPGSSVKLQLGPAGGLLEHMARDAQVDVLAGADSQTVTLGIQLRLLVPELNGFFASNSLVLVAPASQDRPLRRLSDLALPEVARIAMGREASVPAGRYAREAINAQRLWPSVQYKVVLVDDVPQVLELVAKADVEAGFVYATDAAAAAGRVRGTTTPVRYLANLVADSRNPALAREFIAYLRSDEARAVFKRLGFGVP